VSMARSGNSRTRPKRGEPLLLVRQNGPRKALCRRRNEQKFRTHQALDNALLIEKVAERGGSHVLHSEREQGINTDKL
jgi:hypothetical protein